MKTFYIETFGCQMNVHDSEKVIGTLVSEGYRQVERPEDAELILYNTCSIRDKAEQKNLWAELLRGGVDIVASDHSPSSPDRKAGEFWGEMIKDPAYSFAVMKSPTYADPTPFMN